MRFDELQRKVEESIRRSLTQKDLVSLCTSVGLHSQGRKLCIQDRLVTHISTFNFDELLAVHKRIDDCIRSSSVVKSRQIAQKLPEQQISDFDRLNFEPDTLHEAVLQAAPISLFAEVPIEYRDNLVVGMFTNYNQVNTQVPTQPMTGINDRATMVNLPNKMQNIPIAVSPFYCCSVCLHPLSLLKPRVFPSINQPNRQMSEYDFSFFLSENAKYLLTRHRSYISGRYDYKWQILLRFIAVDPNQELPDLNNRAVETMPPYLSIRVNNQSQPLWDILPSNCKAKEGRRHSKPVNISDKILEHPKLTFGYRQNVNVSWWQTPGVFQYYYMGIYLERKLLVSELLDLFASNRHANVLSVEETMNLIKTKLEGTKNKFDYRNNDDDDDDLEISSVIPVSLLCPIGKGRIEIPLRTLSCQHVQCFDARLYLAMNERRSQWKCPVCENRATPNDLFCDKYFEKILKEFSSDETVTEVNIRADGTYTPIRKRDKSKPDINVPQMSVSATNNEETVDETLILLDSDDETDIKKSSSSSNNVSSNDSPISKSSVLTQAPPSSISKKPDPKPIGKENETPRPLYLSHSTSTATENHDATQSNRRNSTITDHQMSSVWSEMPALVTYNPPIHVRPNQIPTMSEQYSIMTMPSNVNACYPPNTSSFSTSRLISQTDFSVPPPSYTITTPLAAASPQQPAIFSNSTSQPSVITSHNNSSFTPPFLTGGNGPTESFSISAMSNHFSHTVVNEPISSRKEPILTKSLRYGQIDDDIDTHTASNSSKSHCSSSNQPSTDTTKKQEEPKQSSCKESENVVRPLFGRNDKLQRNNNNINSNTMDPPTKETNVKRSEDQRLSASIPSLYSRQFEQDIVKAPVVCNTDFAPKAQQINDKSTLENVLCSLPTTCTTTKANYLNSTDSVSCRTRNNSSASVNSSSVSQNSSVIIEDESPVSKQPPSNSFIPTVTIDLTEDDDDDDSVIAYTQNIPTKASTNHRSMIQQQWMPVTSENFRSISNPSTSIARNQFNKFASTTDRPTGGQAPAVGHYKPYQSRRNHLMNANTNSNNKNNNIYSHSIDLTSDDEPKQKRLQKEGDIISQSFTKRQVS